MNKMRITIVGPGIMPIPPKGWGAVESLIWDYKLFLEKIPKIVVTIVNTPNASDIIRLTNDSIPDIIHIQYDNLWTLWNSFECKNVMLTSHYGYLDQLETRNGDGYVSIFKGFIESNAKIISLSPSIQQMYVKYGCPQDRVCVVANGANADIFRFSEEPKYTDRSIYLAKIDYRKRQSVYQNIDFIDFVGNNADSYFNIHRSNYKGEWSKTHLYEHLTDYVNLVLLSDGEAHPLVCCEALICGLGLVVSEFAAANLDTTLPWIDVIPTGKLNDIEYVKNIIRENQIKSLVYRKEIREYGLKYFSWDIVIKNYLTAIQNFFAVKV
jgi:glycosyltransferase involved in cell wall biosynthesis